MSEKCKERVFPNDKWGAFYPHRCNFNAVKDGYCTIHHPEYVKKKDKRVHERAIAKQKRTPEYRLRLKLEQALEEIEELKKKNRKLKKRIKKNKLRLQMYES